MKRKIAIGAVMLMTAANLSAQIYVKLPKGTETNLIKSEHALLSDIMSASSNNDVKIVKDVVKHGKKGAEIVIDPAGASRYRVEFGGDSFFDLYVKPGEKITLDVKSLNPFECDITGSQLMTDIDAINKKLAKIEEEYGALMQQMRASQNSDPTIMAKLDSLGTVFENINLDFIKANPISPAVCYAITNITGENCVDAFESMTPQAQESILMPFAVNVYERQKRRVEADRATKEMLNNHVEAPDFTLKDIDGKDFRLSSLRGKYVVLDFWGSWCVWCIKGMPALKAAYEKYNGKLEVVGVDCNETEQAWRAGVEKYKLPWINVYNPGGRDSELLAKYNVQGFPTKVLIDPEGHIVDVCVGEDPTFYDRLAEYLK